MSNFEINCKFDMFGKTEKDCKGKIYYVTTDKEKVTESEICGFCKKENNLYFIIISNKPNLDFEAIKFLEHIYFTRDEAEAHLKELKLNEDEEIKKREV